MVTRTRNRSSRVTGWGLLALVLSVVGLMAASGCNQEDCVSCVGTIDPPVVPVGVTSVSGDNAVTIYWYDISYSPYDGRYNENVVGYVVYYRDFNEGDLDDPNREFYYLGEVAWDENFDWESGLHWLVDTGAVNGYEYEYAVSAVNAAGMESALSYEAVIDAPLPMSPPGTFVEVFDSINGSNQALGGFDFSQAGETPQSLYAGRVDPNAVGSPADIRISFEGTVPYVERTSTDVRLQDFGVFTDSLGNLIFEGVSWAPADGYSHTGKLELVKGHVYVVELYDSATQSLHYAKFGVVGIAPTVSVQIVWAYQLIPGLPELMAPEAPQMPESKPRFVRF